MAWACAKAERTRNPLQLCGITHDSVQSHWWLSQSLHRAPGLARLLFRGLRHGRANRRAAVHRHGQVLAGPTKVAYDRLQLSSLEATSGMVSGCFGRSPCNPTAHPRPSQPHPTTASKRLTRQAQSDGKGSCFCTVHSKHSRKARTLPLPLPSAWIS